MTEDGVAAYSSSKTYKDWRQLKKKAIARGKPKDLLARSVDLP